MVFLLSAASVVPTPTTNTVLTLASNTQRSLKSVDNGGITQRSLRSNDEERADVTNLAKVFTSGVNKLKYKKLETSGKTLNDNPTLFAWLKYTLKYRAKNPGDYYGTNSYIFGTMIQKMNDAKLAKAFISMEKYPRFKTLSKELQKFQYDHWILNEVTLEHAKEKLRLITQGRSQADLESDALYKVWRGYGGVLAEKAAKADI